MDLLTALKYVAFQQIFTWVWGIVWIKLPFFKLFILKERERAWGRSRREGERESQAGSVLSVQSPMWGLELTNHEIMTWAKNQESDAEPNEPPRHPNVYLFFERERKREWESEHKHVGEGQRGGERIWSRLCADSSEPNVGLEPTNHKIMTWTKVTQPTGPPCFLHFKDEATKA